MHIPEVWFTDTTVRFDTPKNLTTIGGLDHVRWTLDADTRIWLTTVTDHPTARADADPIQRRTHPALILDAAVHAVCDETGGAPFPWDVMDVVSAPVPPEDYLPVLGRGRMVINGRLYMGTTVQVDSSIFVATVVDELWIGAFQPRLRHHPKLLMQ